MKSDMTWYDDAACAAAIRAGEATADDWFPENAAALKTKKICASCPVREPCLEAGYRYPGIWGGLSENERKKLQRRRCPRCNAPLEERQRYCEGCRVEVRLRRNDKYRMKKLRAV